MNDRHHHPDGSHEHGDDHHAHDHHGHGQGILARLFHSHGHDHTHGTIAPGIASTERGIWAVKWSFVILAVTAAVQVAVVIFSGSIALLADTIHNIADAGTAIPLWIAFAFARRKPSPQFTYGFGRVEDLAGVAVVLIILFSAIVAGYEAISRIIHPQAINNHLWVAVAGVIGFLGNEAVAIFRIRIGREINSAALIADGYHARTDGLTSFAVVLGAGGVWLGFPLADPIIGLLITAAIFGIVWQSVKAVFTRMLDGVESDVLRELRHASEGAQGVRAVSEVRARWIGHRLHGEVTLAFDPDLTVAETHEVVEQIKAHAHDHLPALDRLVVATVPKHDDVPA